MRRWLPPLVFAALLAGAFSAGSSIRRSAGIEFSADSLRALVQSLGPMAPILYLGMIVFRNFLAIPSVLLLTTGGLLFGVVMGTLLGGVGIALSGVLMCTSVRLLGRDWIRGALPRALIEPVAGLEQRLGSAGPMVVALSTAHPVGVLAPLHWAYGLTSLPVLPFAAAVLLTAPIRAFLCASFGAALADPGSPEFWRATLLFAAASLVPLAIPRVRRRLLLGDGRGADRSPC